MTELCHVMKHTYILNESKNIYLNEMQCEELFLVPKSRAKENPSPESLGKTTTHWLCTESISSFFIHNHSTAFLESVKNEKMNDLRITVPKGSLVLEETTIFDEEESEREYDYIFHDALFWLMFLMKAVCSLSSLLGTFLSVHDSFISDEKYFEQKISNFFVSTLEESLS